MRKTKTTEKVPFLAPDVQTKVIPAPTGGWDAISPLAEMDPKRAPILQNWIPRPGFVELRGGYIPYSNSMNGSAVETLITYRSQTTEKFFAAAGSKIVDVTVGDTPTDAVTGLTNARWQYVNFTPANATTVIQCVNGVDTLRQYNGSAWSEPAITGLPGGTTANIIQINAQKRRLWYIMNNSTVAAFMPTDAITGPIAGTLDLGALWVQGGYLMAMAAWTIDGGSGPQDYALFISSRGEVAIYAGTDPTTASAWGLVGVFRISPPIGRRCFLRMGSDVAIITQQGVIPISQALPFDPSADRSVAITARIQNAMAQAALTAQNNFGWQLIAYPNQQVVVLNVPYSENSSQQQFVMNVLTGAWAQFTGWNANCFEIFGNDLYFGGNSGQVNKCFVGSSDFTESIPADMQCAFNWLDDPGRTKRMTMVQPLLTLGGSLTPTIAVDTDFQTSSGQAPISVLVGGVLWDQAIWDESVWSQLSINYTRFLSVQALGHAMAVHLRVNITNTVSGGAGFDYATFDSGTFDASLSETLPLLQCNAFNVIYESGGTI